MHCFLSVPLVGPGWHWINRTGSRYHVAIAGDWDNRWSVYYRVGQGTGGNTAIITKRGRTLTYFARRGFEPLPEQE